MRHQQLWKILEYPSNILSNNEQKPDEWDGVVQAELTCSPMMVTSQIKSLLEENRKASQSKFRYQSGF